MPTTTVTVPVGSLDFTAEVPSVITQNSGESNGIPSSAGTGTTGAVLNGTDNIKVFIANVDRSEYVAESSIVISMQTDAATTCRFVIKNKTGTTYCPLIGQDVIIYNGEIKIFGGTVESTEESGQFGRAPVFVNVVCNDFTSLLDRRIVGFAFTPFWGGSVYTIAWNIVALFLNGSGIHFVVPEVGTAAYDTISTQIHNYVTVREALQQTCDLINWTFRVDFDKNLRIFPKASGYMSAPFSITDVGRNHSGLTVSKTRGQYRNRQGIKNNQNLLNAWTDKFPDDFYRWNIIVQPGEPIHIVPTTYDIAATPVIMVNGVEKVVVENSERSANPNYDYWFFRGGIGVFPNEAKTLPTIADTIVVSYPGPLSPIVWVQDDAEIALHGIYEAVEEAHDLTNVADAEDYAASLLTRGKTIPVTATIKTQRSGIEPGQNLIIDTSYPACDATLVVNSVEYQEVGKGRFFWCTVRAITPEAPVAGSALKLFQKIIEKIKQGRDRNTYIIGFGLAIDVRGKINPGLEAFAPNVLRVAVADGIARDVTLKFKSVDDGALTDTDIIIDILQNGFSIFRTPAKVTFPKGVSGTLTVWDFASNPLVVRKGDVFTIDILQADPKAKNGFLELTVYG